MEEGQCPTILNPCPKLNHKEPFSFRDVIRPNLSVREGIARNSPYLGECQCPRFFATMDSHTTPADRMRRGLVNQIVQASSSGLDLKFLGSRSISIEDEHWEARA
ncbi:hypothetical protein HPP92_022990 [Vanilla planifolia]|uniref:Uncharacterized protein n=1 Tax=Vanilla planifolia TaxID=51239 RepID=A0A835PV69_VANPL|nr:hypothetical protein HPP92_022990 [Vanilla planifolia]